MSNEAQAWARAITVGSCGRKAVLMALANRADESWSCYPGQELIARETEQTSRTVRSHLEALEEQGLIRREVRRRQDGYRTSDRYFLLPEKSSGDLPDLTGNERTPHRKSTRTSPETVSGQETSVEPSVETTGGSRKRSTSRPPNWGPNSVHQEQANADGLDLDRETESFKAWTDARGAKFANWDAAFRNHLIRAGGYAKQRNGDDRGAMLARLAAEVEQETLL